MCPGGPLLATVAQKVTKYRGTDLADRVAHESVCSLICNLVGKRHDGYSLTPARSGEVQNLFAL
jgi:hypothetical protein